jgi:hypothetical protein
MRLFGDRTQPGGQVGSTFLNESSLAKSSSSASTPPRTLACVLKRLHGIDFVPLGSWPPCVRGFRKEGGYYGIPLELNAYELEKRSGAVIEVASGICVT